jgi:hypothetical protein
MKRIFLSFAVLIGVATLTAQEPLFIFHQAPSGGAAPSFVSGSAGYCNGSTFSATSQACSSSLAGALNDWIVDIYSTGNASTPTIGVSSGSACAVSSWNTGSVENGANFSVGKITTAGASNCYPQVSTGTATALWIEAAEVTGVSAGIANAISMTTLLSTASPSCSAITTASNNDLVICGLIDADANNKSFTAGGTGATFAIQGQGAFGAAIEGAAVSSSGSNVTPSATYAITSGIVTGDVSLH